jgi:hypothetical protein
MCHMRGQNFGHAAFTLGCLHGFAYTPRRILGKAVIATGLALPCASCDSNDRLRNRVIEATPAILIFANDHPGQGRDEPDVGDNMLILSMSLRESAAGSGSSRSRMRK